MPEQLTQKPLEVSKDLPSDTDLAETVRRDEYAAYAAKGLMDESVKRGKLAKEYDQQQADAFANGIYAKMDMAVGSPRAALEVLGHVHARDYAVAGRTAEFQKDLSDTHRLAADKVIELAYQNYDAGTPDAPIDSKAVLEQAAKEVAHTKAAARLSAASERLETEKAREAKGLPNRVANMGRIALARVNLHRAKANLRLTDRSVRS